MITATTAAAIRAAVAARVAVAFPAAHDATADAAALSPARLPAYAVTAQRVAASTVAMGSALQQVGDRVTVSWWAVGGPELRASLDTAAQAIGDAVTAAPRDLAGLAFDVSPAGADVVLEDGEQRAGRAEVVFDIAYFI